MNLSLFLRPAAALLLGAFVASAQTAAPVKVGIIHIQNAILGTQDGKKAAAELDSKSQPKKRELEKMQADIRAMTEQMTKTASVGSEEQKVKLRMDIDAKTKSFNRQVEDAQAELDQDQNRVLNEIGGRMLQVIDKYARDNAYALIFDVSNQNTPVLFASNTIDVTQDIVGLYDKNAPATPATGTAPATGASQAPITTAPKSVSPGTAAPKTTAPGTMAPKPVTPPAK